MLPWEIPSGKPITADLLIYDKSGVALDRNTLNRESWWPAVTAAGIAKARKNGMHALRHFYASVLDAGESIKALAAYLGHSDPGFTLRTYTHLMPTRSAPATRWTRRWGTKGRRHGLMTA
ncbi:site-specific integrase [Pilimelia anulata]|uniref:site-specific integrase n=1 Tax=Pilimelia anulata TaxID=53371 RepID=UPI001E4A80E1|nr:site-specific integrase [Pilimelia anulata]